MDKQRKIAIVGLGYVGLPVALAFARKFPGTVGFDINAAKVQALKNGVDETGEITAHDLKSSSLKMTSDANDMRGCDFFVVAVPTPVDKDRRPDLRPVVSASETVGKIMSAGSIVVFESTVYPGVTEEICGPVLEQASGLKRPQDFTLGYSPERINPGDKEHTLERIIKVVSGENADTLEIVARTYSAVVTAGVHRAPTIKVAEAAKVIENTQRDLNIALMNELSLIFDRLEIRTKDVLDAAGTKWNFLRFAPGLVGGHCIGVDPYYLTAKAEEFGYHPQVITAGRRINDGMGAYIAQKLVKLMIQANVPVRRAKIGILGMTFKENVSDIRNSRVPDIIHELEAFGISPLMHDPAASPEHIVGEYGLQPSVIDDFSDLDALVLAVTHREYLEMGVAGLQQMIRKGGIFCDIKSQFSPSQIREDLCYWSL